MWLQRKALYTQIGNDQESASLNAPSSTQKKSLQLLGLVTLSLVSGAIGFLAFRSLSEKRSSVPYGPQLERSFQTFIYDRNFSYPPSPTTDRYWRGLFPEGGGFFNHPTLPSTLSTISVLHQLHCLDGIRHGYWANNEAAVNGKTLNEEDLPQHIRSSHIRHCIDLLRQTLMCHGDTTIEVVNNELGGVTGFDTQHYCTSWDSLSVWLSKQTK